MNNRQRRVFLEKTVATVSTLMLGSMLAQQSGADDCERPQSDIEGCEPEPRKPFKNRIGLCLSGGGYRAMLFHAGTLLRLYETGLLHACDRLASVSGGSIAAGVLALHWQNLPAVTLSRDSRDAEARKVFLSTVIADLYNFAKQPIDVRAGLSGLLLPGNINSKVEKAYEKYLYKDKTLQDLPERNELEFIFLATNLQSGVLVEMSRAEISDYRVGRIESPKYSLAKVVAASSAFPPFLSPSLWKIDKTGEQAFQRHPWKNDLHCSPYTTRLELSDGGVYDNLGLEPLKEFKTVFVSDAGGKMRPDKNPQNNWLSQSYRVLSVIDNQVRSLRKRWLISEFNADKEEYKRAGSYWSTRTRLECFPASHHHGFTEDLASWLARIPTRLSTLEDDEIEGLINWGYLACALNLWKYYCMGEAFELPYPVRHIASFQKIDPDCATEG